MKKTIALASLLIASVMTTACSLTPTATPTPAEDASWANRVTFGTSVGLRDAASIDELTGKSGDYLKGSALMAGGFAMAPKGAHSIPALDALLFLDMLGGKATPTQAYNEHNTLAWFPAGQADSPTDAQAKFHKLRLEGIKAKLEKLGAEYRVSGFALRLNPLSRNKVLTDNVIIEKGPDDLCDVCVIVVNTAMPVKNIVTAPAELTGQPFQAYFFDGSKDANDRTYTEIRRIEVVEIYGKERRLKWKSRKHHQLAWLTETYPEWAVEFISILKPETLKMVENGTWPGENPCPFLVHQGQIHNFIKGQ